jgi:hypothetical protein
MSLCRIHPTIATTYVTVSRAHLFSLSGAYKRPVIRIVPSLCSWLQSLRDPYIPYDLFHPQSYRYAGLHSSHLLPRGRITSGGRKILDPEIAAKGLAMAKSAPRKLNGCPPPSANDPLANWCYLLDQSRTRAALDCHVLVLGLRL